MWSGRELLVASLIGGTEIIEKCLENGIDVNIRRDEVSLVVVIVSTFIIHFFPLIGWVFGFASGSLLWKY